MWIVDWLLKPTEQELREQYQIDVVDCHPYKDKPVPVSFEEWKNNTLRPSKKKDENNTNV